MSIVRHLGLALIAGSVLSLSACGFVLRGSPKATTQISIDHSDVKIITDDSPLAYDTKRKLEAHLARLGVASITDGKNTIKIHNLRYRRYELVGVLTEIRLLLTADVSFDVIKDGKRTTITRTIDAERSYQFNEAGVATNDQQGDQAKIWLQSTLAERIAEQYYTLGLGQ